MGTDGHGDGVMAHYLKYKPTDLTALARNNHGVFPEKQVKAIIDGTKVVGPHGGREMPVWGREFVSEGQPRAGPGAHERLGRLPQVDPGKVVGLDANHPVTNLAGIAVAHDTRQPFC